MYYQLNRQKIFSLWLITVYNFSSSTTSNDFLPKGKHTFKFKSCTLTFQKLDKQMISLGYCNRFSDKFNNSFNKKQHNFYWIYYALTLKPSRRNQKKEKRNNLEKRKNWISSILITGLFYKSLNVFTSFW